MKTCVRTQLVGPLFLGLTAIYGMSQVARVPLSNLANSCPRPVTVKDMIEMTSVAEGPPLAGSSKISVAQAAPDGKSFLIVTRKGDVARNTNVYSIQQFQINRSGNISYPKRVLLSMSSSSNRPAIYHVQWLNDRVLTFIGETPGSLAQVYSLDVMTKRLRRVTQLRSNVVDYAVDDRSGVLVAEVEKQIVPITDADTPRVGITVQQQSLRDLLTLSSSTAKPFANLLVYRKGQKSPEDLRVSGKIVRGTPLYLSPNGRFLIVMSVSPDVIPQIWNQYDNIELRTELGSRIAGDIGNVRQFQIIDLHTGNTQPLLNSPIPHGDYPDVVWSPDSGSVALGGVYLPLTGTSGGDLESRRATKSTVELYIATGEITSIFDRPLRLERWDRRTGQLIARIGQWLPDTPEGAQVSFLKYKHRWNPAPTPVDPTSEGSMPKITLEQASNSSPKLFIEAAKSGIKQMLLDLNPQFKCLEFGKIQPLQVGTTKDRALRAGIYLPTNFSTGKRYPLIIQTHGWDPDMFWIDGPYSTAFAAQAFAGEGFVVAQIGENYDHHGTLAEVKGEASGYDQVIEELDRRGLIDVGKIGIIGFSRTVLGVQYALTHSRYHFAAATIADGSDYGYFHYIAYLNSPAFALPAEKTNGGVPMGADLHSWIDNAPEFNLDKVSAPVRLEAMSPESVLFEWEWFQISRRIGLPVDFIYLPESAHPTKKPWDRIASQQGNVDWFTFWLTGRSDKLSADENARWIPLRDTAARGRPDAVRSKSDDSRLNQSALQ